MQVLLRFNNAKENSIQSAENSYQQQLNQPCCKPIFWHIQLFSLNYSQVVENKQKNPTPKFFQLLISLTFAFPKMGVALYCI